MYTIILKVTIIMLSFIGFWGVGGISYSHWTDEASCPMIGPVPACYLILVGYGAILLSVLLTRRKSLTLFLSGWIPVIVLALIGIIGEVTQTLGCPMSEIGIPKCYFSGALSLIIGWLYWRYYKTNLNKPLPNKNIQ